MAFSGMTPDQIDAHYLDNIGTPIEFGDKEGYQEDRSDSRGSSGGGLESDRDAGPVSG